MWVALALRLRLTMDSYIQIWSLQTFFARILTATHYVFIDPAFGFTHLFQEKTPRDEAGGACVPFWMQCNEALGRSPHGP